MKKYFADSKAAKERAKQKKIEVDRRTAEPPSYHSRESEETSAPDDEEAQIEAAIQASLTDQYRQKKMARYRAIWIIMLRIEIWISDRWGRI